MAKKDDVTAELPGVPRRRGRPPTGKAKSSAVRQAEYRDRLRAAGFDELTVIISQDVQAALAKYVEFKDMTLGEAVDRIMRDRLLRPR